MSAHVQILHASCVAVDGRGVLLLGPSGSGKSDLALRLVDAGAKLVADDQVAVTHEGHGVVARHAPRLAGLLEVRGVGIMTLPYAEQVTLMLAVKLVARAEVERMPHPQFYGCAGEQLPLLSLHAFDAATGAKIRMVLAGMV